MSSALVTGVTGQDGSYLAELLVARNWKVHGTVRPGDAVPSYLAELPRGAVELHQVDLLDGQQLREVFRVAAPDVVFNLAGLSSVAQSWSEPALTAKVNGVAACELLELAWRQQEESGRRTAFLQASSAEIFAGTRQVPQDEQTPTQPLSPYGAAKAYAHQIVQVYRARGLHSVNVILYNHESPRRPVSFVTRKITSTVAAIARGDAHELVLGNLEARRDWGWAPDYVDAMVRAVLHDSADDYVVASGTSHSVADFVAAAFARVGVDDWSRYVRTDAAFDRPTDAVELVGDASRAREVLGWRATVGFEEVVGRMVDQEPLPGRVGMHDGPRMTR